VRRRSASFCFAASILLVAMRTSSWAFFVTFVCRARCAVFKRVVWVNSSASALEAASRFHSAMLRQIWRSAGVSAWMKASSIAFGVFGLVFPLSWK